jgi:hypothetical protein
VKLAIFIPLIQLLKVIRLKCATSYLCVDYRKQPGTMMTPLGSSLIAFFTLLAALGTLCQAEALAEESLPTWMNVQISELNSHPKWPAAIAIWRLEYKNEDMYLFVSPCCDQFNNLYDRSGTKICSPTGGITGRGDGNCSDAISPNTKLKVIWPQPGKL